MAMVSIQIHKKKTEGWHKFICNAQS